MFPPEPSSTDDIATQLMKGNRGLGGLGLDQFDDAA